MADNVSIRIPTVLRTHVDGQAKVDMAGGTVGQVLGALLDAHPTLKGRLMDEKGEVNRFINVYLNDEDVRFLENLETPVKDGDTLMIVPSIAGG
jgi:molybdopterin converting factor small subunit